MKRITVVLLTALMLSCLLAAAVSAGVPHLIRFQGKLTDKSNLPLNGGYDITFRIYNGETGGTLLWSETQMAVPVNNGIFSVLLGNVQDLDLPFDEPYWLSMEVSNDGEMLPRQRITSVGYAYRAEVADSVSGGAAGVPQGAIILWTGTTCPSGYSRFNALDGKFIVGGPTYDPAAGGSNTHDHGGKTVKHILTIAEMPAHDHAETAVRDTGVGPQGWIYEHETDGSTVIGTKSHASQGGGQGHSHPIPVADNRPEFATVIFCQKD